MKRIVTSLVFGSIPFFLAYLGGMEFVRGFGLSFTTGMGMFVLTAVYTCPVWWDE